MSLRDQLLKKGLVSKGQAAKANRELKKARKTKQANKKKKRVLEREAAARAAAESEAENARLRSERRERDAARDAYERALQVRNILIGNRVKNSGNHTFFVRGSGHRVHRLKLHPKVALELSRGGLAAAELDLGNRIECILIGRRAAERLQELAPEVVVHFTPGPHGDGPEGALMERDWEISLRPHRVR